MYPLVSNLRQSSEVQERPPRAPSFDGGFVGRFLRNSAILPQLNSADRDNLQSLSREASPQLLMDALLALGGRWENGGREADALQLYHQILQDAPAGILGLDRVRQRFDALQGRGAIGARVEVAARNFLQQATDPAMIFGFMVAGGAAAVARNVALGSLALRAETWLTRGWRARAIAGGVGMAVEVPALVGATRLAQGVLRYDQGFGTLESLPAELGGAALFLGALKIGGTAARSVAGRGALAPVLHGAGTLGGIYLGHRAQEQFRLRPGQDEMNRWFDATETFLQLRIGGRIATALTGAGRGAALEAMLLSRQWEAEALSPRLGLAFGLRSSRPLQAAAGMQADGEITQPVLRQELDIQLLRVQLGQTLGERATSLVAQSVQSIAKEIRLGDSVLHLTRGSQYRDLEGFELGMRRLDYAVNHAFPRGLSGSYLNWVVRVAGETAMRRQDQPRFDRLLQFLAEGASVVQLESLVSEMDSRFRLFPESLFKRNLRIAELMTMRSESHRLIRTLTLPKEAKQSLHAYDRVVPMQDRLAVVRVVDAWLRKNPEQQSLVRDALLAARLNPAGGMRIQRMVNVLMYEPSNLAKLRELADADLGIHGRNQFEPPFHEAELLLNSQYDGYLAEPDLARQLSLLYRRLPDLLDAEKAAQRRARTQRILEQVWPTNRTPVDSASLRRALAQFGDPMADAISQDLAADRFRLVFLPRVEFETMFFEGVSERFRGRSFGALFRPAAEDPSGRHSIYLLNVEAASHTVHREMALMRMVQLVHEHVHLQRADLQSNRSSHGIYLEEMTAETQAIRWRAEQGDVVFLRRYLANNPAGLGLHLRDWVNLTYFASEDRNP